MPAENFKIESADLSIATIFKDFYTVPDFQREYVWQPSHVEKLLEDAYDEFYDELGRLVQGPEYFLGTVVACQSAGIYQLIDGQQRMTTIYLVLCAAKDALIEAGAKPTRVLEAQISDVYSDPKTGNDIERHRLTLQYEDSHGILEEIVKGDTLPSPTKVKNESVKNIIAAYETIRDFYRVNLKGDPEEIKKFLVSFTSRIKLIRIVTPSITNALKVFETINDRGVGLNAMDLLKNLLFMKTSSEEYPKLKQKWKSIIDTLSRCGENPLRFLRYYIMAHYPIDYHKSIREDEIYDWFVTNATKCGIDTNPLGFCDELIAASGAYENFLSSKDVSGKENRYLRNITLLGGAIRQQNILLLAARKLEAPLFDKLCQAIENLFFCYLIIREPTKIFEKSFAQWSEQLRAVKNEAELDAFLDQNFRSDMAGRAKQFDFALNELRTSNIQQYRLRYILAKLSQYIEENAWGSPAYAQLDKYIDKSIHIEHILPQTPEAPVRDGFDKQPEYEDYVPRLGNLTLLEKTINTSISNGSYSSKTNGYKQSTFLLTKSMVEKPKVGKDTSLNRAVEDLQEFKVWDSKAIEARQKMLTKLARQVWDMPEAA